MQPAVYPRQASNSGVNFGPAQPTVSYQQAVQSYATHKPVNFYSQTEVKPQTSAIQMVPAQQQFAPAAHQVAPVIRDGKSWFNHHLINPFVID